MEGNSNRSQAGGRGLTGLKFGHTFKTLIRYLSRQMGCLGLDFREASAIPTAMQKAY